MPENQSLGVVMDNQQPVENKIHIQALHQPDPDFFDDSDQIKNILELIEYYLTFQCNNFGDLYADFEGNNVLLNKIHIIMFDPQDDKQGRIRDEVNKVKNNTLLGNKQSFLVYRQPNMLNIIDYININTIPGQYKKIHSK